MITIAVRTPTLGGAGANQGAAVDRLAPIGGTWSLARFHHSTNWHIDPGVPDQKLRTLDRLAEVVEQVELVLREASERGLHVTYSNNVRPMHEFWPYNGLPIVTVQ